MSDMAGPAAKVAVETSGSERDTITQFRTADDGSHVGGSTLNLYVLSAIRNPHSAFRNTACGGAAGWTALVAW